jgi:hypothetical protein
MKKYTNMSNELRVVRFGDGNSQFLMRGQSVESAKQASHVQDGIRVSEVKKPRASKKTTESDSE